MIKLVTITSIPRLDMVIAHKTDTGFGRSPAQNPRPRAVSALQYDVTLRMLIAAKCSGPCA